MDIQHMKTVKQLYATDMTKTTKLTMRLVTICLQSINARRVTTKKHKNVSFMFVSCYSSGTD